MTDDDARLLVEIADRDERLGNAVLHRAASDRRELLRIVREMTDVIASHRCFDLERLAQALDAPGVFEDPLGDKAMELAETIWREYEALS